MRRASAAILVALILYSSLALSITCPGLTISFVAAHPTRYTPNARLPIKWIIIHAMSGTYLGSISWFQQAAPTEEQSTSAHYLISRSGEITQMVRDDDTAHHAGNWRYNQSSIGIELEDGAPAAYQNNPAWATDALYLAAARLVRCLVDRYGIAMYHPQGTAPTDPQSGSGIIGHNQVPGTTKQDPGPYWDWVRFMNLVASVGCDSPASIWPTSATFGASGGSGSVNVTAPSGCRWTVSNVPSWITITWGSSGSGNGTVYYTVAANTSTSSRSATLTIAGQSFTVSQSGVSCTYSIYPTSASFGAGGGSGSVNVTAPSGCGWTVSNVPSWITITWGSSGSGNGTVYYTVAANTSTSSRSATITIAGQSFTVTQAGASSGVPNDEPSGATLIGTLPFRTTQNTAWATSSASDPVHSCTGGRDSNTVWFRWVATFTGRLRVDTYGSNYDTVLAAYTGSTAPGPELACNDDSGGTFQSRIEFAVTSGQSYLIQVSDFGLPGGGNLVLNVRGVAPGDYNGDGRQDLIWQNDTWRQATVHYYQGANFVGWAWLNASGATGWRIVGTADFDSNGTPDPVWQNDSTRQVVVHYYDTVNFVGWNWLNANSNPGWRVVALGDFNRDGKPDLVWQNDTWRQVAVHYYGGSSGNQFLGWAWLNAPGATGWRVVGAADFDGNGTPDLVWQNDSTRQVTVHYYAGAILTNWSWLNASSITGWSVAGVGDFNGDLKPDLVWQNDSTRQVTVHYYGGSFGNQFLNWAWLNASGATGWRAIVPR